jgi:hypothetical protein
MPSRVAINGKPPQLAGKICEAFICEGFRQEGKPMETAQMTYLRFDGVWTDVCFEGPIVFWRERAPDIGRFKDPEHMATFPSADIAAQAGVLGQRLKNCEVQGTGDGCSLRFVFETGRTITLLCKGDVTNYVVA